MAQSGGTTRRKPRRRHDQRLPSSQRGYDRDWRELADLWLSRNPLCKRCLQQGRVNAGGRRRNIVDHIIPIQGKNDPNRLRWSNLQTLCFRHHQQKTAEDQRKKSREIQR